MAWCDRWKQTDAHFPSLTVPEIDSCRIWANFVPQIVPGLPVSLWSVDMSLYFCLFVVCNIIPCLLELYNQSLLWWIKRVALWDSNYRNSSLKWASHVIKKSWKPQHNPAKLLVGHGFTLNYGVFHPQGIMLTHSNGTLRLKVQLNVSVEAIQCACQHNNVALIEF